MRTTRWLMPLFAVSVLLGAGPLVQPAAAGAGTAGADVVQIAGAGAIEPGLTVVPAPQVINFAGDAVITGLQTLHVVCDLNGNGLGDSYAEGEGVLAGNCGPIVLPSCIYERVGVELFLVCVSAGSPVSVLHGHFLFTPQQLPPATIVGFGLQGAALYADVT